MSEPITIGDGSVWIIVEDLDRWKVRPPRLTFPSADHGSIVVTGVSAKVTGMSDPVVVRDEIRITLSPRCVLTAERQGDFDSRYVISIKGLLRLSWESGEDRLYLNDESARIERVKIDGTTYYTRAGDSTCEVRIVLETAIPSKRPHTRSSPTSARAGASARRRRSPRR